MHPQDLDAYLATDFNTSDRIQPSPGWSFYKTRRKGRLEAIAGFVPGDRGGYTAVHEEWLYVAFRGLPLRKADYEFQRAPFFPLTDVEPYGPHSIDYATGAIGPYLEPDDSQYLTLLTCEDRAVKEFYRDENGEVQKNSFLGGYSFAPSRHRVRDIRELHDFLLTHEKDQHSAIIRGEPLDPRPGFRPRRLNRSEGKEPTYRAADRRWAMIDIDEMPIPEGVDPQADPRAAFECIRAQLPAVFHEVAFVGQWSSSMGLRDGQFKAHLWFYFSEPIHDEAMKDWLKGHDPEKLIDRALFNAVQMHYFSAPVFRGIEDPHPQRTYLIDGAPEVVLEGLGRDAYEARLKAEAEKKRAERKSKRPRPHRHAPVSTAAESDLEEALIRIDPDCDYETWFKTCVAFKGGGGSYEAWDRWCATGAKYSGPEETWAKWSSVSHCQLGAGYLFWMAGWNPRQSPQPIEEFTGPTFNNLAGIRAWLDTELPQALAEGGVHVIDVPIGSGKTHATRTAIRKALREDRPVCWTAPTQDLKDEFQKGAQWLSPVDGRNAKNCRNFDIVKAANRVEPAGGAAYCGQCPLRSDCRFIRDRRGGEKNPHLTMTHAMYVAKYGAPLESLPLKYMSPPPFKGHVSPKLIENEEQELEVHWVLVPGNDPFAIPTDKTAEAPIDVTALVAAGRFVPRWDVLVIDEHMGRTLRPFARLSRRDLAILVKGDIPQDLADLDWSTIELREHELEVQREAARKSQDPIKAMEQLPDWQAVAGLADAIRTGGVGVHTDSDGNLILPYTGTIDTRRARCVIVLDATGTSVGNKALYGEHTVHAARLEKPSDLEVIRVDSSLGKREMQGGVWRSGMSAALFAGSHVYFDSPTTLHVVHKDWAGHAREHLEGPTIWFEGTEARGSNAYEHCETVVCASFHVPTAAVVALGAVYAHQTGQDLGTCEAAARIELEGAAIRQAIGRIRPYSGAKKVILVDSRDYGSLFPELSPDKTECPGETTARAGYVRGEESFAHLMAELAEEEGGFFGQKTLRAAWTAGGSSNTRKCLIYIGRIGSYLTQEENLNVKPAVLEEYARSAGLTVTYIRTSQPGRPQAVYHSVPLGSEELALLCAREGWMWAEGPDGRAESPDIAQALVDAASDLGRAGVPWPRTRGGQQAALATEMGVSPSTVKRRMRDTQVDWAELEAAHERCHPTLPVPSPAPTTIFGCPMVDAMLDRSQEATPRLIDIAWELAPDAPPARWPSVLAGGPPVGPLVRAAESMAREGRGLMLRYVDLSLSRATGARVSDVRRAILGSHTTPRTLVDFNRSILWEVGPDRVSTVPTGASFPMLVPSPDEEERDYLAEIEEAVGCDVMDRAARVARRYAA